jgi:hypothetical protein
MPQPIHIEVIYDAQSERLLLTIGRYSIKIIQISKRVLYCDMELVQSSRSMPSLLDHNNNTMTIIRILFDTKAKDRRPQEITR